MLDDSYGDVVLGARPAGQDAAGRCSVPELRVAVAGHELAREYSW
ncbi:hypothetical protein [Mycobacterium pseudokansasii]|nr:hypothetical protein [Mycobacterium pseudokansasii]EUA00989.1 hypothetical protein I546_6471 [Mycobacterium kansasii 732]